MILEKLKERKPVSRKPERAHNGRNVSKNIVAGKGSGKREFYRSGSIETARFQGVKRPTMDQALIQAVFAKLDPVRKIEIKKASIS